MSVILKPIVLNEKSKSAELIAQLDKVPLGRMYQASFKAVVRLHLYFTGRTHELFLQFTKEAKAIIMDQAGKDQVLDGSSGFAAQSDILKAWGDTFNVWRGELDAARVEAASIPFGVLAVAHERMVLPRMKDEGGRLNEAASTASGLPLSAQREWNEAVQDGVFSPQLNILLNAGAEHLYGDSLNLSARVWNIDREARDGINAVLMKGIANSDSAWNVAKELEQYLGTDADCPRWTTTRLYGLTKTDIARGDTTGLLTNPKGLMKGSLAWASEDNPCSSKGVSYNALRLARTEIQKAHALATDKILASQPWVENEQINTSPSHGEPDECDDVAKGGEKSDGIYPVGTIELPLHPNCLCFKTAVLMNEKEFTSQLNGWMKGEQDWAEMDDYEKMLGGDVNQSILPNAINLAVWLFDNSLEKRLQ